MTIAQSKITAQGQVSIPAEVRRRLGLGPGSLVHWDEENGEIVLRRSGGKTFEDLQRAVFGDEKPEYRSLEELEEAIPNYIRAKHARH